MIKKAVFALCLLTSACSTHRFAEFGIVSPEITNLTIPQLEKAKIKNNVRGTDIRTVYFVFPDGYPSLENAIQNALQKNGADILANVKADYHSVWYGFWGYNAVTVTGDAVSLAPMIEGEFFNE